MQVGERKNLDTSNPPGSELKMSVEVKEGKVVINFSRPIPGIGLNRDQARSLGKLLMKKAKKVL